jgi:hypothetical protein
VEEHIVGDLHEEAAEQLGAGTWLRDTRHVQRQRHDVRDVQGNRCADIGPTRVEYVPRTSTGPSLHTHATRGELAQPLGRVRIDLQRPHVGDMRREKPLDGIYAE